MSISSYLRGTISRSCHVFTFTHIPTKPEPIGKDSQPTTQLIRLWIVVSDMHISGMSLSILQTFVNYKVPWPSWLRRGANNAKISGSIPLGTIYFSI